MFKARKMGGNNLGFRARLVFFIMLSLLSGLWVSPSFAKTCDVSLSGAEVNYGRIVRPSSKNLSPANEIYALGQRSLNLSVHCSESSALNLWLHGEALGGQFKFEHQGQVRVILKEALLDGRTVQLSRISSKEGDTGGYASSIEVGPGDSIRPISAGQPASGAVWTLVVEVRPTMPLKGLHTAEAKTLRAHVAFEVRGS